MGQGKLGSGRWELAAWDLTTIPPCRIQKSMLLDLNKEIMNELGVTVVGDIIAILKHAKVVHRQVGAPVPLTSGQSVGLQGAALRQASRRPGSQGRCSVQRQVWHFAV